MVKLLPLNGCELVSDCIFEITKHTGTQKLKYITEVVNWYQIVSLK